MQIDILHLMKNVSKYVHEHVRRGIVSIKNVTCKYSQANFIVVNN